MVKTTLEIRHLEYNTLSSKHPLQTLALCHTLWVPGNTKIHNIIVPEAGEKDTEQKTTIWSGEYV